jgi:hypothetical protein
MILTHAKDITKAYGGVPVRDAVLVVPAFYTQPERQALMDAAEIADIKVRALLCPALPESTLCPALPPLSLSLLDPDSLYSTPPTPHPSGAGPDGREHGGGAALLGGQRV